MPDVLPGADWKPVPYRLEASLFPHRPIGWVLHVVVGNGSPWKTFAEARSPHRRFSTAWVAKDGHGEQYQDLIREPWAQVAGNATWWAIETEGFPDEPLTDAQIDTLARWHNFLHVPDVISTSPKQAGIGTHYMGGGAWGGHSCPDPVGHEGKGPRSHQRADILHAAVALRNPPPPKPHPEPKPSAHHVQHTLKRLLSLQRPYLTGPDVGWVQEVVGTHVDDVFGPGTDHAVRVWQDRHDLVPDGDVGPKTARAMGFLWG